MIAALASPLARWAGLSLLILSLAGWALLERGGRHVARLELAAAEREAKGLRETIRTMEVRRREDDRAIREPDPVGRLRDEWTRPD